MSPWSSSGSCCSATRPVWTSRTVLPWYSSGIFRLGLLVLLLALIFFRRRQALMPCIMAVMDQIDSYVVFVQGHQNPCRGAEAIPMDGIPQLPHIWVVDVPVPLQLPCRDRCPVFCGHSADGVLGLGCCRARRYAATGARFPADTPQLQFSDTVKTRCFRFSSSRRLRTLRCATETGTHRSVVQGGPIGPHGGDDEE